MSERKININKAKLIATLQENKAIHIKEYNEAVTAYKKEALRQLSKLKEDVNNGSLKLSLDLITPVNISENYDKTIKMFDWELKDKVELSQSEFTEYVLDETHVTRSAKFSNSTYLG